MKTKNIVKASLFTLILAFVVATVAATGGVMKKENEPKMVEKAQQARRMNNPQTWYFTGSNPELPESYSDEPLEDKECGAAQEVICEVFAPADSLGHLDMLADVPGTSQKVIDQIQAASSSRTPNETVKSFREE